MMVLLSFAPGMWFSSHSLPFPGHILIYGPPVSQSLKSDLPSDIVGVNKIDVHFFSSGTSLM